MDAVGDLLLLRSKLERDTMERRAILASAQRAVLDEINRRANDDPVRWKTQLPGARWANGCQGVLNSLVTFLVDPHDCYALLDDIRAHADPIITIREHTDVDVFLTAAQLAVDEAKWDAELTAHNAMVHAHAPRGHLETLRSCACRYCVEKRGGPRAMLPGQSSGRPTKLLARRRRSTS